MRQEQLQSIKKGVLNFKGFSLVEVMLAISVFGLLVTVLIGILTYSQSANRSSSDRDQATFLAEEALEAVRNIRDDDFSSLVDGQYGLAISSGHWTLVGTEDEVENFTRSVDISTVDQDTKKIVARVEWVESSGMIKRSELVSYLSNWQKEVIEGSCALTCQSLAYPDGTCRADAGECITNSETNESAGDSFCTVNPDNTCCCNVTPDPTDEEAPSAISDLQLSEATPSSIKLSWTAPGDDGNLGQAAAYDIRYSTTLITEANWSEADRFSTDMVPASAGTEESITVDGIMADTEYYFAIKTADESSNISAISNVPSLNTLPPLDVTPPAAIIDLNSSDVSTDSVTLDWTAPGDDGSEGVATSYEIRYSLSLINDTNWSSATEFTSGPEPLAVGTAETVIISSLEPATRYYFAIKTSDEVPNQSGISNVIDVLTLPLPDTTAPAAVTDLSLSTPTPTTISLSWTAPGDDGITGTATNYDIRYSTEMIDESNWISAAQLIGEPAPVGAGTAESAIVNGLTPDVTYYFAMKTADEVPNLSIISNVPYLKTAPAPDTTAPSAISDLVLSAASTTSITLSWTAPGDDASSGTATTYDIRYSTSLITEANWADAPQLSGEPSPGVSGTSQNFVATGLNSNTNYYFAMKTSDEAGNISNISNVPNLSTLILVNSCETYCSSLGYVSGVCGTPETYCIGIDSVSVIPGRAYCGLDYCCCGPITDTISPSKISTLSAPSVSYSVVTLTWKAPGDNGIYGTASSYDIRFSTSLITDSNWDTATQVTGEPMPVSSGLTQSMSVDTSTWGVKVYFGMKTSDEVGNVSSLSNVVYQTTQDVAKVICTDAYKKGYMPIELLQADYAYADKYANQAIMRGYHSWGKPVVRIIQNNLKLAKRVYPFTVEWSKHTAYELGVIKEDSPMGKMLIETAFPLCEKLGEMMIADGQWSYEFDDRKVEAVMEKYYQDYYNLGLSEEELVPLVKRDFEIIMAEAEKTYLEDRANNFQEERFVYGERWFVRFIKFFNNIYNSWKK